jgi:hypothetical protein
MNSDLTFDHNDMEPDASDKTTFECNDTLANEGESDDDLPDLVPDTESFRV